MRLVTTFWEEYEKSDELKRKDKIKELSLQGCEIYHSLIQAYFDDIIDYKNEEKRKEDFFKYLIIFIQGIAMLILIFTMTKVL
jgi:hypothetical protein